jgi:hypothetical protein
MTLRGSVTNARIAVSSYAGEHRKGTNLMTICGATDQRESYDCLEAAPTQPALAPAMDPAPH